MWHNIGGKIDAIKAIKELPFIIAEDTNVIGVKIQRIKVDLSLKDAKDLVEKIMSLEDKAVIFDLQEKLKNLQETHSNLEKNYWDLKRKLTDIKDRLNT